MLGVPMSKAHGDLIRLAVRSEAHFSSSCPRSSPRMRTVGCGVRPGTGRYELKITKQSSCTGERAATSGVCPYLSPCAWDSSACFSCSPVATGPRKLLHPLLPQSSPSRWPPCSADASPCSSARRHVLPDSPRRASRPDVFMNMAMESRLTLLPRTRPTIGRARSAMPVAATMPRSC